LSTLMTTFMPYVLIVGGSFGALARFVVSCAFSVLLASRFPIGTWSSRSTAPSCWDCSTRWWWRAAWRCTTGRSRAARGWRRLPGLLHDVLDLRARHARAADRWVAGARDGERLDQRRGGDTGSSRGLAGRKGLSV